MDTTKLAMITLLDALASFSTNGASKNAIWTNTIAAAPNTLLLVGINFGKGNGTSLVTNVLYGATNLTLVASRQSAAQYPVSQIWQLVNPPSGTNRVTIKYSGAPETLYAVAAAFTGVDTNTPLSAPTIATNANIASLTNVVASSSGAIVFDVFADDAAAPTNSSPNQTKLYMLGDGAEGGGCSYQAGAPLVTNIWRMAAAHPCVDMAVTINAASGGGGGGGGPTTNATAFVQTPAFALPFLLPSNGVVSITNFITVTNGAAALKAASNSITATLQTNGVNFLTRICSGPSS